MNVLLLLDLVPDYHHLLVGLGRALNHRGHTTYYAIDSPVNQWRFREHPPAGEFRIFSKFLAEFNDHGESPDFPWDAFFPDFDRYEHYGVNWGKKQDWYIRLGCALNAYFETCVRDWHINAIVYEGVNNSFAYFASKVAARHGVTYIALEASRLPGRHELRGTTEDGMRQKVKRHYSALLAGQAIDPAIDTWVTTYLEQFASSTPDYMATNGLLLEDPISKYARLDNLSKTFRLASYQILHRAEADRNYRSGPPLTYSIIHATRSITRWLKSKFIGNYFSRPESGDSYYLYPLHFHPESATSVLSRWYVDEYPAIKNLAFSLPAGTWLYVKDHPSAFGYPPRRFYKHVSRLPNVKLIPPELNAKQLVNNSLGVITQTGTMGYEALVLRKPVWVLGEVFYDFHPGCLKVGWTSDLADSFLKPRQAPVTAEQARLLVTAYYLSTRPGALPLQGEDPATISFDDLAREIADYVVHPDA